MLAKELFLDVCLISNDTGRESANRQIWILCERLDPRERDIDNVVISKNLKQVTGEGDVPTANAIDYDGTIEEWLNIKFNLKKEMFAIDGQGILRINGKQVNEIITPEDMTEIHDYQFAGMALSTVYVPKSLKRIGKYAFAWCHDLERVQYSSVKTLASAKKCLSKTDVSPIHHYRRLCFLNE